MASFTSLQQAKDFLNQKAKEYTYDLDRKWGRCSESSEGYIWCNNLAGVIDMLLPYSSTDHFVTEALNDFIANGYIEPFIQGGIKITPKGYQNIGAW